MSMIRSAVVGVGYLGQFHAQKFALLQNTTLVGVCDIDLARSQEIADQLDTRAFNNYTDLIGKVDAVSIAVPTAQHYPIAKAFLDAGVHVLLEKPITNNLEHAQELIDIAKHNNLVFQIGHLERFNPALVALDSVLNNPRFIESVRLAPFKPRGTDVSVVLDLMIHDIDIIQRIVGAPIVDIQANGAPVLSNTIDMANARLQFQNGCVANVTASRVSFNAERKCRIFQPDAHISVDMHNKKLTVHRLGQGEMFPGVPDITSEEQVFDQGDALLDEIVAFLDSIANCKPAVVSGQDGKAALATAMRITQIVQRQMTEFQQSQLHDSLKEPAHVD